MGQPKREIVFQPQVYAGMQRGIHQMVAAIRPTLGPLQRSVAIESSKGRNKPPELLDDGGVIARRIYQLPDRDQDVGAMLVRHMLTRLQNTVGDGTATAAVIFQAIFDEGMRYVTAGGNAMRLRHHLEHAVPPLLDQLGTLSQPITSQQQLMQLAATICQDAELAASLAQALHVIGAYGQLDIRSGGRDCQVEFVEGMYWKSELHSPLLLENQPDRRASVEDALVLISDLEFEDSQQLAPLLARAMHANAPGMMLIANKFSAAVIGLLVAAQKRGFAIVAARPPSANVYERATALSDLAVLTGGQVITQVSGVDPKTITLDDLGRAHRAWSDRYLAGLVGGYANPRALREFVSALQTRHQHENDPDKRQALRARIGNMLGGLATVFVGGATQHGIETRKALAQRAAETMRRALEGGVLPGGGSALLACRESLHQQMAATDDPDARAAYRILASALQMPTCTLLMNSGIEPNPLLQAITDASPDFGFDVHTGQIVHMRASGILDATAVLQEIVYTSIYSAASALTIDTLVHSPHYHQTPAANR